jgi:predicted RNA-binding Zn-ribbon protein involved in translation (DUF1610 family)
MFLLYFYPLKENGEIRVVPIQSGEALFACPQCGKLALTIHRKTYEENVILFCCSCKFSEVFVPPSDIQFDAKETWEEFKAQHQPKKEYQLH